MFCVLGRPMIAKVTQTLNFSIIPETSIIITFNDVNQLLNLAALKFSLRFLFVWSVLQVLHTKLFLLTVNYYRKFSIKGAGRGGKPLGHFHLPVAFYRMKIELFLTKIWPKTSRNPKALGSRGGGALNGEFTVVQYIPLIYYSQYNTATYILQSRHIMSPFFLISINLYGIIPRAKYR